MSDSNDTKKHAAELLAALDVDDLADVLLAEFDRRRLNAEGNPTDAPGVYWAACVAMLALLGLDDSHLAERLADAVRGPADKPSTFVREIAFVVAGMDRTRNFAESEKPRVLARTLAARFGCEVDESAIVDAWGMPADSKRAVARRISAMALAVGIDADEELVKQALRAFPA